MTRDTFFFCFKSWWVFVAILTAHNYLVMIYQNCFSLLSVTVKTDVCTIFFICDPLAQMKCKTVFICVFNCILMHALSVPKIIFLWGKMDSGFFKRCMKCIKLHLCVSSFLQVWCNKSLYPSGWLVYRERQDPHHPSRWCNTSTHTTNRCFFLCTPPPPPKKKKYFKNTIMQ